MISKNFKKITFNSAFIFSVMFFYGIANALAEKDPSFVALNNPLNLSTDVRVILGTVVQGVLGVMGGLVLLMVVWGGSTWLTAAGNPEKVKSGSQTILWALLGSIITVSSYIILSGIMKFF